MDCSNCANYKPKGTQEPEYHEGRIYTEDLHIGMVIRRHGTLHDRKLAVIVGEPDGTWVKSLQLLAGYKPVETDLSLEASGLQPYEGDGWRGGKYCRAGSWAEGAWCEEVK